MHVSCIFFDLWKCFSLAFFSSKNAHVMHILQPRMQYLSSTYLSDIALSAILNDGSQPTRLLDQKNLLKCGHRKQYCNTFKLIIIDFIDDEVRRIEVIGIKVGLPISWTLGVHQHFCCQCQRSNQWPVLDFSLNTTKGVFSRFFVTPPNGLIWQVFAVWKRVLF